MINLIPEFSVRLGGTTSVDITKPGIDKAYGIRKLRDTLGIAIEEMIFIGDALFPGGNDYPAKEAGVVSIQVRDPNESKRVIEAIIACLDGVQPTKPPEGDASMSGFQLQRLGLIMEPEPGNPLEVEGILNPAAVRGPDGQLYLFPRLVAKGNYSRIGIARVTFNRGRRSVRSRAARHCARAGSRLRAAVRRRRRLRGSARSRSWSGSSAM